jgi:hypothetical protein
MRLSSVTSKIFGRKSVGTSDETQYPATQFLIVFDTQQGRIVEQRVYVDSEEAMHVFGELEHQHVRDHNLQVLLFTADSLETVKSTHPHYFSEPGRTDPFGLKPIATAH